MTCNVRDSQEILFAMSFQTTPVSWRSGQTGQNQLLTHSAYDPLHSFAYTSAYSGRAPGSRLTSSAEGIQVNNALGFMVTILHTCHKVAGQ